MNELNTTHFGTIRFNDDDVLTFPAGVPGFWHATRFLLLPHPSNRSISYLQSADVPSLRFILVAAFSVVPEYELSIEPWDIKNLAPPEQVLTELESWFVISTPQPDRLTINMLAPVVISRKARRGVQAVRSDTRYSHAFPLDDAALELARRPVC
jgi:flagellar assembly factor FliW